MVCSLLSHSQSATLDLVDLDENEAAFSLAVVNFSSRGGENILVVGTAKDTLLSPRSCSSGYLRTYTFAEDGKKLELLHIVSYREETSPSIRQNLTSVHCLCGLYRPRSTTYQRV